MSDLFASFLTPTAWHWFAFALILAGLEILAPATVLIWFALGAGLTAILLVVAPELALGWQLVVFALASLTGLVLGRAWLKRSAQQHPNQLNDRAQALVGRKVMVIEDISAGRGAVQVGDSRWAAQGPNCPQGSWVRITAVGSSVVTVEPAEATG